MNITMNCNNCANTFRDDITNIKRCQQSGLRIDLVMAEENFDVRLCAYHIPLDDDLVPDVVRVRFAEELKLNRLRGWRTLAQLCAGLAVNAEQHEPGSQLHRVLTRKADEAYRHMRALQPLRGEEYGIA